MEDRLVIKTGEFYQSNTQMMCEESLYNAKGELRDRRIVEIIKNQSVRVINTYEHGYTEFTIGDGKIFLVPTGQFELCFRRN